MWYGLYKRRRLVRVSSTTSDLWSLAFDREHGLFLSGYPVKPAEKKILQERGWSVKQVKITPCN